MVLLHIFETAKAIVYVWTISSISVAMTKHPQMGVVGVMWSILNFGALIVSLVWVKLVISNLVFKLILTSTCACMIDVQERDVIMVT